MLDLYRDLLLYSQRERRGLTFYVRGQALPGVVRHILEAEEAVEVYNQGHDRIVIRLEAVDALAQN